MSTSGSSHPPPVGMFGVNVRGMKSDLVVSTQYHSDEDGGLGGRLTVLEPIHGNLD